MRIYWVRKCITKVTLPLGSNARACRFESCHPHQKKALASAGAFLFPRLSVGEKHLLFGENCAMIPEGDAL